MLSGAALSAFWDISEAVSRDSIRHLICRFEFQPKLLLQSGSIRQLSAMPAARIRDSYSTYIFVSTAFVRKAVVQSAQ